MDMPIQSIGCGLLRETFQSSSQPCISPTWNCWVDSMSNASTFSAGLDVLSRS